MSTQTDYDDDEVIHVDESLEGIDDLDSPVDDQWAKWIRDNLMTRRSNDG